MPRHRLAPARPLLIAAAAAAGLSLLTPGALPAEAAPATVRAGVTVNAGSTIPSAAGQNISWNVGPADTEEEEGRANFDYAVDPGQSFSDAFTISNDGTSELTLDVYASDAFTTREGNIDLLPAATEPTDAGTWIALERSSVTLAPGESTVVPFTVTVPADARPGDHPAGIVASLSSDDPEAQVQVDRRLGSRMYLRVSGDLIPSVATTGLSVSFDGSWNPFAPGMLEVSYTFANTGNTRVTAASVVDASGPFGVAPATSGQLVLPEVLPGSEIAVVQTVSGVGALFWLSGAVRLAPESIGLGAARLDPVVLDYGVAAVPVLLVVGLLVLAAIAVTVWLVVRRRRAARAPDANAPAATTPAVTAPTT